MRIIEIATQKSGAHRNQTGNFKNIPNGWAVIPKNLETKNFPFGEVKTKVINGVLTVTKWIAGNIPEEEEETNTFPPSAIDDVEAMLIEHEYKLTLIETGVTE